MKICTDGRVAQNRLDMRQIDNWGVLPAKHTPVDPSSYTTLLALQAFCFELYPIKLFSSLPSLGSEASQHTADVVYPRRSLTSVLDFIMNSAPMDKATSCHVMGVSVVSMWLVDDEGSNASLELSSDPRVSDVGWLAGIRFPKPSHEIGGGGGRGVSRPSGGMLLR